MEQSGGTVTVSNTPGGGAVFEVLFPRVEATTGPVQIRREAPTPEGGQETILLAEDDPDLRDLLAGVLGQAGYQVLVARDGEDAIDRATAHAEPIDLLVTDVVMPGVTGPAAHRRILDERPGLPVLYLSGYAGEATEEGVDPDQDAFLAKPFQPADLLAKIRQVLGSL